MHPCILPLLISVSLVYAFCVMMNACKCPNECVCKRERESERVKRNQKWFVTYVVLSVGNQINIAYRPGLMEKPWICGFLPGTILICPSCVSTNKLSSSSSYHFASLPYVVQQSHYFNTASFLQRNGILMMILFVLLVGDLFAFHSSAFMSISIYVTSFYYYYDESCDVCVVVWFDFCVLERMNEWKDKPGQDRR